jgi:SAM-dependent methyltransferase
MFEQTKAAARRANDPRFANLFLVGNGIDICAGPDMLAKNRHVFPHMADVRGWDMPDGDAQYLKYVAEGTYDFVHSSHGLEHMVDPHVALDNWIRVCKVGGYLVITVPDEELYEHNMWPSNFNGDHKWSFTLAEGCLPKSIRLPDFFLQHPQVKIVKLDRIIDNFDFDADPLKDQTFGPAECAIEFVLKRVS